MNDIDISRMEVISFGKMHATGDDDATWAQDRRVDVVSM